MQAFFWRVKIFSSSREFFGQHETFPKTRLGRHDWFYPISWINNYRSQSFPHDLWAVRRFVSAVWRFARSWISSRNMWSADCQIGRSCECLSATKLSRNTKVAYFSWTSALHDTWHGLKRSVMIWTWILAKSDFHFSGIGQHQFR